MNDIACGDIYNLKTGCTCTWTLDFIFMSSLKIKCHPCVARTIARHPRQKTGIIIPYYQFVPSRQDFNFGSLQVVTINTVNINTIVSEESIKRPSFYNCNLRLL